MAVLIKIRKKDKKFRPWSTVVDDWYFEKDWLTREECVAFLKHRIMRDAREKCKELEKSFPNGYSDTNYKRHWFNNPKELKN